MKDCRGHSCPKAALAQLRLWPPHPPHPPARLPPRQVSGTPPPVRNAHAGATVGTDIYIFGGRCGIAIGEAALDDLHRFDTTTATWHAVEPAGGVRPPKRSYAAATCARGRFYVFGGCGAEGCGRLNDMWEFDPATAAWRQLPTSGAIRVRGAGLC